MNFKQNIFLNGITQAVAALALLCSSGQTLANSVFVVKDIRIEGIQRTEAGTVFSYLPIRVGDVFTDDKGTTAIKTLYATGFFKDVKIETQGEVLIIWVEERPAIASIEFSGFKEFDKELLLKALKDIGLSESRIFERALVERAEQELKRQYLSRGLYGAKITTTVTPIERNRVTINFSVEEGDVARIKNITFIGNRAFSDKELQDQLSLHVSNWFSWYTKNDQYSRQKLTGDTETLKSFYLNNGYIEMNIESTQVSITPDKKDIYVTINLSEGQQYTIAKIQFDGEMFGREEELRSLLKIEQGTIYSGEKLTESVKRISERMGNFGYAFANVNVSPEINREKKEVAFTFLIDPGKRAYVHRINIAGNTKTRDEVIRRELRQLENSWYDGEKIRLSRDRVDRLGYFKEVDIETPEVLGTNDQVDINMTVTEKATGNISLGAGFSTSDKLTLTAGIQQSNIFGSGNTVGIDLNTSKRNRTIALSHTDPYFTDDGVSRSTEVFLRTVRPPEVNTGDYRVQTLGANTRFGVPFTEADTVYFGLGVERTKVETFQGVPEVSDSPFRYIQYATDFGDGINATTTTFPLTIAWQRDDRDNILSPSKGQYQRANLELAQLGDLRYYRGVYQHQYFIPWTRSLTAAFNGEIDYGRGLNGKPYPIFKNFYAGGIGSVRGYEASSLGTLDKNGDPIGGSARLIGNIELQLPFPGTGLDRALRWFAFFDAGNVFDSGAKLSLTDLRYSTGLGISWISPVGPLKLSYGKALNSKSTDKVQTFQFQIGTGF